MSNSSLRRLLKKNDIRDFLRHIKEDLNLHSLGRKMSQLLLEGSARFGRFNVAYDCNKNHLDVTISTRPLRFDDDEVLTLNLAAKRVEGLDDEHIIKKVISDCLVVMNSELWADEISMTLKEEENRIIAEPKMSPDERNTEGFTSFQCKLLII